MIFKDLNEESVKPIQVIVTDDEIELLRKLLTNRWSWPKNLRSQTKKELDSLEKYRFLPLYNLVNYTVDRDFSLGALV
ncbi:hypothetical protein ACS0TY_000047 [Phlomoides rotata]